VPRLADFAPLMCAACLAWSPAAQAQNPIPASTTIDEQVHEVEIEVAREGATVRVTRSLFNPTLFHARVDLPVELPCEATVDEIRIEERGANGASQWRMAELLDPDDANARFDAYYLADGVAPDQMAGDSNTALLVTRDDWACDVDVSIWPIPPVAQRTFAYRVFIPSVYDEGRYTIELPSFANYGLTPELKLAGLTDAELLATVDNLELDSEGTTLDGARSHTLVLSPSDPGRGQVRAVDLDVHALVHNTPTAAAKLAADAGELPRMLEAELAAPATLAQLPPVRRAVVLLDASHSVSDYDREQLQNFGAAYFEALAKTDARVEVLLFDREVRRVYHDFVPAAWGADDLGKLEIEIRNGSEVGEAVDYARALLAEPSEVSGADWIIVLSDLYLRSDFDVTAEREAADDSAVRLHVVRELGSGDDFGPAVADDPWTAVARAAGGMAWETDGGFAWADELVSPKYIWNLRLELELENGSHRSEPLDHWLEAGRRREWSDYAHAGPAMVHAAFVGEVWGQRRAWTASPDPIEGQRTAAALATHDPASQLSDAVRTALAFHAGVVSPFSSAWALAQFEGAAPAPAFGYGIGGCGGGSFGSSTRCGGARSSHCGGLWSPVGFDVLAQQALDHCGTRDAGQLEFETTDLEIVAVTSAHRCMTEQTWATDIASTDSYGRKRVTVAYAGGHVTNFEVVQL
jgi:hypothetical protein